MPARAASRFCRRSACTAGARGGLRSSRSLRRENHRCARCPFHRSFWGLRRSRSLRWRPECLMSSSPEHSEGDHRDWWLCWEFGRIKTVAPRLNSARKSRGFSGLYRPCRQFGQFRRPFSSTRAWSGIAIIDAAHHGLAEPARRPAVVGSDERCIEREREKQRHGPIL